MTISSLRFDNCVNKLLASAQNSHVEFGGFSNAILEFIFSLSHEEHGMLDSIIYCCGVTTEKGVVDRMARVHVTICGYHFFFFVFGEAKDSALNEWKIIGRSILMRGKIRMPSIEEVTWF